MPDDDQYIDGNGVVISECRGIFQVEVDGKMVQCTLSGKIKLNNIKVLVNDKVKVKINIYDLSKGRIMFRIKE